MKVLGRGVWIGLILLFWGCRTQVPDARTESSVARPEVVALPPDPMLVESYMNGFDEMVARAGLEEIVSEGLIHNRDLRSARARLQQVEALLQLEKSVRRPQLSLTGSAARTNRSLDPRVITGPATDLYELGANASWEVDLWGGLGDRVASQAAESESAQADFEAARRSLAVQIVTLSLEQSEALAQLALAEETVANYRANERLLERRFEAGLSSALDLRLARTSRLAAQASAETYARSADVLTRALEILLGRYPEGLLKASGTFDENLEALPEGGVPAQLAAIRPDLRAAEARYVAAAYEAGAARKLRYPQLRLGASLATSSGDWRDLLDSDLGIWNLFANLTAPIYQGGAIEAQIESAAAGERAALEDFAARLLQAYQEIETTYAAETILARQLAVTEALVAESEASEALSWDQYRKGLTAIPAVLEAQRQAFSARSQLLTLRSAQKINRLDFYRALGGPLLTDQPDQP